MSDAPLLLIVRQRPIPHAELENLISKLQEKFRLDPYTTRQHLLGPGLAQLAKGRREHLEAMAELVGRHAHPCWVVPPPQPRFVPSRLHSLKISAEAVDFSCEGERSLRLERGMTVVGILADLSGTLAGRQVKRLLARNAYLGRGQAVDADADQPRRDILKGQPVFDCYLLDSAGAVTAACRAISGRFNPQGLDARAALGAARNLEALVDLVREYAGSFRLFSDFGLSHLPGCLPQPVADDPAVLAGNLDALTRYGWLVTSLGEAEVSGNAAAHGAPGIMLAAGLGGAALATGTTLPLDGLGSVATSRDDAVSSGRPVVAVPSPAPVPLPPPPERPEQKLSLRRALPVMAIFLGGVVLVFAGRSDALRPVFRQALHSGLLPGLLAAGMCWGAFFCLQLKRRIEDTPTSRIRSLAMGLVEVHGRALRRYALVAPMTQGACAWYRLRKYRRDSNNRWTLASVSDSSHVPFVLDDGSGQVVVDPAGATIKVNTLETRYPGESSLIGAAVDGGPDEKWVEELIYEGTPLYVLGYARPARGVGLGLRERTVDRLRQLKLDHQALHRYDTDGDGRIDEIEWQAARDDAERQAAAEHLAEPLRSNDHVQLGKPPRGLPFLIAEGHDETTLARRYSWLSAILLGLGMVVFGLAVKLFLALP